MKLEQSFVVAAPIDEVWATLNDLERVAPCLPGAAITEHDGATTVHAATDFSITGRLARFGRGGMMQDISNRLLRDFSTCLQSRLAEAAAASERSGDERAARGSGATTAGTTGGLATARPAPAAQPQAAKPIGGIGLFFSVLWERIRRRFGSSRD